LLKLNFTNYILVLLILILSYRFFIDCIASFPYTWAISFAMELSFEELENSSTSSPVFKTPRLLKLFKIARMLRMLKLLRIFKV